MSIYAYKPYFYIIQNVINGTYYAGSKYGQKKGTITNPANFMIEGGYTTSSNKINELIEQNGLDLFIVRKLKVFKTKQETIDYETRFLQKVNARSNPRFYNCHNNDGYYDNEKAKQRMIEVHGVDNYAKSPDFKEKFQNTSQRKYGVDHHLQNSVIYAKHLNTLDKKYGVINVIQIPESKEKARKTKEERYGNPYYVNPEKAEETCLDKYGFRKPGQQQHLREQFAEYQHSRFTREIVDELKELIEIAKTLEIDYGSLGLKRFWWQSSDDKLIILRDSLRKTIEEKNATGFVKKTKTEKMQEVNAQLYNRPIVITIRDLLSSTGKKLGPAWWRKSDTVLEEMLKSLQ